jgi:hypothetical protein
MARSNTTYWIFPSTFFAPGGLVSRLGRQLPPFVGKLKKDTNIKIIRIRLAEYGWAVENHYYVSVPNYA